MKVQLLPRGIRVYFWISCVRVWTDGNDDTRGAKTPGEVLLSSAGGSSA